MKFIDLGAQHEILKDPIRQATERVMSHGQFILGPEVTELEQRLAKYVGVSHCVGVASGTVALQVALMALGIGPGDEVITTPFSFFATAETILLLGAKVVYVDIDPNTYNLDANLLEQAITKNTKAILPVSMYGQCCDMDAINAIADQHGIAVIEDAAQSFGAQYKQRKSCALSKIACTSFFPSKPLGAYGDAGACFTDDAVLAEKMRRIMNHGQEQRYKHVMLGINGRCDTLQAAILLCKLDVLDDEMAKRQQVAQWYADLLPSSLCPPVIAAYNDSAFAQYTVQVKGRDACQQALKEQGIPTMVHYPIGLHHQPIARQLQEEVQSFPVTEVVASRVLSLPFYPYMQQQQVTEVVQNLQQVISLETVSG